VQRFHQRRTVDRHFRNHRHTWIDLAFNLLLRGEHIAPAIENTRSSSALMAGIEKTSIAIRESFGHLERFSIQYDNALSCWNGSSWHHFSYSSPGVRSFRVRPSRNISNSDRVDCSALFPPEDCQPIASGRQVGFRWVSVSPISSVTHS
jgi:hypothetical protein